MEDESIEHVAHDAPLTEFPEDRSKRVKPSVKTLPPTSNKDFWDGANVSVSKEDIEAQRQIIYDTMRAHNITMVGQEFICTSCPFQHTLSIDPRKFTLNKSGEVVAIDNP